MWPRFAAPGAPLLAPTPLASLTVRLGGAAAAAAQAATLASALGGHVTRLTVSGRSGPQTEGGSGPARWLAAVTALVQSLPRLQHLRLSDFRWGPTIHRKRERRPQELTREELAARIQQAAERLARSIKESRARGHRPEPRATPENEEAIKALARALHSTGRPGLSMACEGLEMPSLQSIRLALSDEDCSVTLIR